MLDTGSSDAYAVLTNQDLAELIKCAAVIPGGWAVDPVTDIRQSGRPCVWLHPARRHSIALSHGVSKRNGRFWISARHHGHDGHIMGDGTPYGSLGKAFATSYGESLLMLLPDLAGT
jgi:hypothetical protein